MNGNMPMHHRVRAVLDRAWPNGETDIKEYLIPKIVAFLESGFQDNHYLSELENSPQEQILSRISSRIWESMLFERFNILNWNVSSNRAGPDFLVNNSVYVEAVTPQPAAAQEKLLDAPAFDTTILRYTASLREKKNRHLNHIQNGYAEIGKPFVIAINAMAIDANERGIAGAPIVAMAVLPIGNPLCTINIRTGDEIKPWRPEYREMIQNNNGAQVRIDNFLDDSYGIVSAVIGCSGFFVDEADRGRFCGQPPYFVVHNPNAANRLPKPWLPYAIEYDVVLMGENEIQLIKLQP